MAALSLCNAQKSAPCQWYKRSQRWLEEDTDISEKKWDGEGEGAHRGDVGGASKWGSRAQHRKECAGSRQLTGGSCCLNTKSEEG